MTKTTTEANTITVQETQITNIPEQTIITTEEVIAQDEAITVSPLRRLTSACKNLWVKAVAKPDAKEIKEIKEARRCELIAHHSEDLVSKVIDEKVYDWFSDPKRQYPVLVDSTTVDTSTSASAIAYSF